MPLLIRTAQSETKVIKAAPQVLLVFPHLLLIVNCCFFADIHALAHISNLVSVQLNHYQYLFLLRLADQATELVTFLNIDSEKILKVGFEINWIIEWTSSLDKICIVEANSCFHKKESENIYSVTDGKHFFNGHRRYSSPTWSYFCDASPKSRQRILRRGWRVICSRFFQHRWHHNWWACTLYLIFYSETECWFCSLGILRNSNRSIPQTETSGRFVSYSENTAILSQSLPEHNESFTFVADTRIVANSAYATHQLTKSKQQKNPLHNNINVGRYHWMQKRGTLIVIPNLLQVSRQ